jgi:hypothetical protein
MAIQRENRSYDLGHGTRMGFRMASVLGVVVFVAFLAYFAMGPRMSVSENPPAGDTNTPVESMAAPKQQATPTTNSAPATAQQPPPQQPSP